MRLTLINQFYPPDISPTAHLCASLAEHRATLGDQVTVVTSRSGYAAVIEDDRPISAVNIRRVWSTRLGSRSRLRRLIDWGTFFLSALLRTATLSRQDVIISMTTPPYIAWAAILHQLLHPRTRIILWNMDCYPEALERTGMLKAGNRIARLMRAMNRSIFRRLDHLIALDGAMAGLLSQYEPHDRRLARSIIPNWENASLFDADIPEFPWDDATAAALRERFVVLYLGNAGYGHEFETLIAAAGQLRKEPVIFLFVGGGAKQEWIANDCESRGLSNILLRDYVSREKVAAIMRGAGCALITLETPMAGVMSPSKLHASLAMGLPILYVGPPASNVDEAIARFGCGISLRPGDADEMACFIRELAANPARLNELRQLSRRAFTQAYCDRQTLPRFDAILG